MLTRRLFLALAAFSALSGCSGSTVLSSMNSVETTRLVVLRHADRTSAMLNGAGVARAARLPAALADLEIDAIYTTPRQRNIDTATPLATERGLPIGNHVAITAPRRILTQHAGETVVWIGNQENLGLFYFSLGILHKPPVAFGDLHVITFEPDGRMSLLQKRRYGD
ncbi:histidine phosphatase family protein [Maritimibacter sp. HL-12]|jgi:hypothetical protein|uniref:histidine phosphatase family protein n=1 Tax=Maritimibacter sp. HL-12 TaxID=1162418 RepID=UPI000A0F27D1|nr:histidine phosphatase family protein [Maritimibacter sp. HL-12]SMH52338.1 Fructose-2,6-bisphosphatase [Maritimibacter sp. HL-12]